MDFFFFQAEDGIRDIGVTGVQTCALPILNKKNGMQRGRAETLRNPYFAISFAIGWIATLQNRFHAARQWIMFISTSREKLLPSDINYRKCSLIVCLGWL